jgi:hypothetical protein
MSLEVYNCIDRMVNIMLLRAYPAESTAAPAPQIVFHTTGILLWGPPGCGKSGVSRDYLNKYYPMYFINTDEIVEYILRTYLVDQESTVKGGTEEEKQVLYWKIRNMSYSEIQYYGDEKQVTTAIFSGINIPQKEFTDDEFTEFKNKHADCDKIIDFVSQFLVFLAKSRNQNFMVETTGNNFDATWVKSVFGEVDSILNVVFVSNVVTLLDRVHQRQDQLMNAVPGRVIASHGTSYYDKLKEAISSGLFEEIVISSNDTMPTKIMMILTKNSSQNIYRMTVNLGKTLNTSEKNLINRVCRIIGFPEAMHTDLHNGMHAVFCLRSCRWIALK